jgi:hypothetical protein
MTAMRADANTVIRAVTIPVATPADMTWAELDSLLTPALRLSTDLANWSVHTLFRLDSPGEPALPDTVKSAYLYGLAKASFPDWSERVELVASSAQCVLRAVQRKYVQDRYAIMFRCDQSLLTYRFPYPFPVHNRDWSVGMELRSEKIGARVHCPDESFEKNVAPVFTCNLPGRAGVRLRLRQGREFGRQLAMVRQLIDGTAKKGEAALYRDRKGKLLVKMVGHFPRRERGEATNVCFLHTDPNALLVAEINGRSVTVTNGDHLKRAHAIIREVNDRHRRFIQRVGEDKKREVRMDRRQRANLNDKVEDRCRKQRARLDTAVKQIAAQVSRFLERQRVGLVAYDDAIKNFLPEGFQWHALKTRLTQLFVGEMGGEWIDGQFAHLKDQQEKDEWLSRARNTALAGKRAVAHLNRSGSHPGVTPPTPNSRPKRSRRPTT